MSESRVAVIVVHGIADPSPGEPLAAARQSMAAVGWKTTRVYTRPVPRPGEPDFDVAAARLVRGDQEIELLECFWADLSRAGDRLLPLLLQVIQVLVGLPSALVDRLPGASVAGTLLRAARFVQITFALPAFPLTLGAMIGAAATERLGLAAWGLLLVPSVLWGALWADVQPATRWRVRRFLAFAVAAQATCALLAPAWVGPATWAFALTVWVSQVLAYGSVWALWLGMTLSRRLRGTPATLEVRRVGAATLASWLCANLLAVGFTLGEASVFQAIRWTTGFEDWMAPRVVMVAAAMALPIVVSLVAWLLWESIPSVRPASTPADGRGDAATNGLRRTAVFGPPVWVGVVGAGVALQLSFGGFGWVSWLGAGVTLVAPFVLYNLTSGRIAIDLVLDVYSWLAPGDPPPRAVMTGRLAALLAHCADRPGVVVLAHSQGTVLAAAVLGPETGAICGLVTCGSPLRQMYSWFLPGEYGWAGEDSPGLGAVHASRLGVQRWINLFSAGDYVGRQLWWRGTYAELPWNGQRREATEGVATDRLVVAARGNHRYFGSGEVGAAVDEVIAALRAPASGAGPSP